MTATAPYRFVPLSRLIVLPAWAGRVSHDHPLADGLCGELELRVHTHTPLCVGGRQDKATEHEAGRVHFFRTPDGKPAIPGSSLKGMLRNVLEIASFARFRQVEDQKLGVRDLSDARNFYCTAIVRSPVHAGWLRFVDGRWQIRPCPFSRLHQRDLIAALRIDEETWKRTNTARKRYALIGVCPELRFERDGVMRNKPDQWLARPAGDGSLRGRVVVTGQPGGDFTGSNAKKFEFVFHDTDAPPMDVSSEVMSGFRQIHESSEEWAFWTGLMKEGRLQRGIPVFFHKNGEAVKSLGLAMMYKLPYAHSLHQAIAHTHAAHLGGPAPDLPELIFGHLGDDRRGGLRGRVNIGLATIEAGEDGSTPEPYLNRPCILSGPKPTFYPAYVRQDGKGNTFRNLMETGAELAGWKRYPLKRAHFPEITGKAADNPKVQVRLETVPASTRFATRLRFHNLRPVELGALLWALDFGGRSACRHGLGMGKPFGLGQVSIELTDHTLRPNRAGMVPEGGEATFLHACRLEFVDFMDQAVRSAGHHDAWERSEPIQALLQHAKPAASDAGLEYLPNPKLFVDLRRRDALDEVREAFHEHAGITPPRDFDTTQPRAHDGRLPENLERAASDIAHNRRKA